MVGSTDKKEKRKNFQRLVVLIILYMEYEDHELMWETGWCWKQTAVVQAEPKIHAAVHALFSRPRESCAVEHGDVQTPEEVS